MLAALSTWFAGHLAGETAIAEFTPGHPHSAAAVLRAPGRWLVDSSAGRSSDLERAHDVKSQKQAPAPCPPTAVLLNLTRGSEQVDSRCGLRPAKLSKSSV